MISSRLVFGLLLNSLLHGVAAVSESGSNQVSMTSEGGSPPVLSGPRIQFAEPIHDFGRVEYGKIFTNAFYFTNVGNQVLEIRDVISSCGCAAAQNWERRVEPGKTGKIPVLFNSAGIGMTVTKPLRVLSNDSQQTNFVLYIRATIYKPIDALPAVAVFNLGPDVQSGQTRVVRLHSNLDEPVTLAEPNCTNRSFRAELRTVKEGREFELQVTVVPPLRPGSWSAPITMKTSSPRMPVLSVSAYAIVQPALAATPSRITLPQTPLANAEQFTVTIRANSANAIALSEPSLNARGAQIQLREIQAGQLFELAMSFPQGFRSQVGQAIEASVKCNHPQFSIVKVPIVQLDPPRDADAPIESTELTPPTPAP